MTSVALLAQDDLAAVFAWRPEGPVSVADYLADVHALAGRLPASGHLLNLCHDRYRFAVGFGAGLLRGMTSLQPSSQSAETFCRLRDDYPDLLALCDGATDTLDLPRFDFPELVGDRSASAIPHIPAEHLAAILFTSGSTGLPQAQRKTWGKLVRNGDMIDIDIPNRTISLRVSEEEIAAVPARAHAELYYCPAQQPGAKFAIVLSGNALYYSGELRGGVSTAWELHEQGYAVFSLRYRIGWEAGDDAPLEDLARAIRFVMDNADTFGVSTEDYALLGYSSGGQIAGVFGNEEKGWGRYGVPKPGVLLLVYPINNFLGAKPAYHLLMDTDRLERRYYSYTVSKLVTPDYPPTFLWYGRNDLMLKAFVYPLQGPTLAKALEASGVPNRVEVYDNAKHGIGIGVGTDAEDWVERDRKSVV